MRYLFFVFLLCVSGILFAQETSDSKNHLLKFEVEFADTLLSKLDNRQFDAGSKKTKTARNLLYLQNRLDTLAREKVLSEFEAKGMPISSNEVLREYIKFGMDKTPMAPTLKGAIKNLGKKGYTGGSYLSVVIKIGLPTLSTNPKGIKPQMEITLRRFDATGKVQSRVLEKYKAPEALLAYIKKDNPFLKTIIPKRKTGLLAKKDEVVFDKTQREFIELLISELQPVLDNGIEQALGKLK